MKLQLRILLISGFCLFRAFSGISQERDSIIRILPEICLSETEVQVFQKVNEYRQQHGLPAVALSKSLTYVAQSHVWDLAVNNPSSQRCNMHSWSSKGQWTACCYTEDHRHAACMWNKPRELTNYHGDGYEIAYWTNEPLSPADFAAKSLTGWKRSPEHNEVILNKGMWKTADWNAMGVGYYLGYTVIWFGKEPDVEPEILPCMN